MQAETAQEQLSVTYPISAFTMHELLNSTNTTLYGSLFQSYMLTNTYNTEKYFLCFSEHIFQGKVLACSTD